MARDLDRFFKAIPKDTRYHLELRTDLYLRDQIFEVLEKYGVGQILSQWTWLPPLRKQLAKAGGRFFNTGNECVIRLLTPLEMRYEDSYMKAHPFDRLIDGMLQPEMVLETVEIMTTGGGKRDNGQCHRQQSSRWQCSFDCPRDCKKIFAKTKTFSRASIESVGSLIISKVSQSDEFY